MAKTYSRSEMTPDLLNLNLQYFFNKPARDYKCTMDEIIITYPADMLRWYRIADQWQKFVYNPPIIDGKLRAVAESIAVTATAKNIKQVLDIFDNLTTFMTSALNNMPDEQMAEISSEIFELNAALYSKEASEAREAELKPLKELCAAEDREAIESIKRKSTEQQILDDLQGQIADLNKLFETLSEQPEQTETDDVTVGSFGKLVTGDATMDENGIVGMDMFQKQMGVSEARERLAEARDNANKIADMMENEIKQQREAEEFRYHEELIRRLDEKEEFDRSWFSYLNRYTTEDDNPTAALFEKFLIDVKGLTPKQISKMEVSAEMFENGIANFIDFDQELQRVKKIPDSVEK